MDWAAPGNPARPFSFRPNKADHRPHDLCNEVKGGHFAALRKKIAAPEARLFMLHLRRNEIPAGPPCGILAKGRPSSKSRLPSKVIY
ncbi:hypothetical protein [Azospirillum doebereinerae]